MLAVRVITASGDGGGVSTSDRGPGRVEHNNNRPRAHGDWSAAFNQFRGIVSADIWRRQRDLVWSPARDNDNVQTSTRIVAGWGLKGGVFIADARSLSRLPEYRYTVDRPPPGGGECRFVFVERENDDLYGLTYARTFLNVYP